jgi:hypothetical protein
VLILHDLAIYSEFVPETGGEEAFGFRQIYDGITKNSFGAV